MKIGFSERTYEKYMDKYLSKRGDIFSPDLGDEKVLGFDSAFFTEEYPIWVFYPPKIGVIATPQLWNIVPNLLSNPDILPSFRLNLFVQYKRPVYIIRSNGNEWGSWNRPYFRYKLTMHQQRALVRLEHNTKDTAVVLYAAPAFRTALELDDHYINGTIVLQSNFVEPHEHQNHHVYTYVNAGGDGRGFSEESRVRTVNFTEKIESALSDSRRYDSNYEFIDNLYLSIVKVMERSETNLSMVFKRILNRTYSDYTIIDKIEKISQFTSLMDLSWNILYERSPSNST